MAQDDKPDSMDSKVDALAAMADGQDISREGFNAIEDVAPPAGESSAAATLASQAAPASTAAPAARNAAGAGASRKARASALQRQRARVHAEQFKRMMVPILLVTGVLLLLLGGIVMVMMRQVDPEMYTGEGLFNNPRFKQIMVITAFPLGAILLIGAWLFRADLKRAEAAAKGENAT
jgi:hypothetical protein